MISVNEISLEIVDEIKYVMTNIDEQEVRGLIDAINISDRVFFVGVGRVLLALESIAKRLAHIGIDTVIVGQITEPAITEKDLLIVGSGSGESLFPLGIAQKAKSFNAKVAHIGSAENSSMKSYRDLFVRIPVITKLALDDEIQSVQPMTTLFEQSLLVLGDTIALTMIKEKDIVMKDLWRYHANLE